MNECRESGSGRSLVWAESQDARIHQLAMSSEIRDRRVAAFAASDVMGSSTVATDAIRLLTKDESRTVRLAAIDAIGFAASFRGLDAGKAQELLDESGTGLTVSEVQDGVLDSDWRE